MTGKVICATTIIFVFEFERNMHWIVMMDMLDTVGCQF